MNFSWFMHKHHQGVTFTLSLTSASNRLKTIVEFEPTGCPPLFHTYSNMSRNCQNVLPDGMDWLCYLVIMRFQFLTSFYNTCMNHEKHCQLLKRPFLVFFDDINIPWEVYFLAKGEFHNQKNFNSWAQVNPLMNDCCNIMLLVFLS